LKNKFKAHLEDYFEERFEEYFWKQFFLKSILRMSPEFKSRTKYLGDLL
jgi:hypothetical protein